MKSGCSFVGGFWERQTVQATLRRLKSEYAGLPERIGREMRRFHAALEAYNEAKQKMEVQ